MIIMICDLYGSLPGYRPEGGHGRCHALAGVCKRPRLDVLCSLSPGMSAKPLQLPEKPPDLPRPRFRSEQDCLKLSRAPCTVKRADTFTPSCCPARPCYARSCGRDCQRENSDAEQAAGFLRSIVLLLELHPFRRPCPCSQRSRITRAHPVDKIYTPSESCDPDQRGRLFSAWQHAPGTRQENARALIAITG